VHVSTVHVAGYLYLKVANVKCAHTCPLQNVYRPRTVEYPTTEVHLYYNRRHP